MSSSAASSLVEKAILEYIGSMSMRHPLYVSDLDGTLLNHDGRLSAFSETGLAEFFRLGVPFTVASGRTFASIRRALGTSTLGLPVISSDGALISPFDSPAPLHLFEMPHPESSELIERTAHAGFFPILDVWDGHENFMQSRGIQNPVMGWYHNLKKNEVFYRWRFESEARLANTWKLISVTYLDDAERLKELRDTVDRDFGSIFKTDYAVLKEVEGSAALWIQHRDARKENALRLLTQMLGFSAKEVVVFGDELNDLGMFTGDWHGVAVGNARDEVKLAAKQIIEPHHEDAVVKYVLKRAQAYII